MDLDNLPSTPEARAMAQKWQQEAQESEQAAQEMAAEQPVVESQDEQPEEVQPQKSESPAEDIGTRNFRALVESKKRIERERDEALALAQKLMAEHTNKPQNQESVEDDFELAPDDIAEGKHLSKVAKKIRQLEQEVRAYKAKTIEETAEARIKAQYPDFDKVASRENIEMLRDLYPELATTLHANPDLYTKAVSTYTMIKNLGIAKADMFVQEKALAQKNAAKPKPLASVSPQQGDSPLARANAFANGLTPDLQKQLRQEMENARRAL